MSKRTKVITATLPEKLAIQNLILENTTETEPGVRVWHEGWGASHAATQIHPRLNRDHVKTVAKAFGITLIPFKPTTPVSSTEQLTSLDERLSKLEAWAITCGYDPS